MTANHGSLKKRILGLAVVTATVGALVAGIAFDGVTPVKAYKTTYKGISELVDNHTTTYTDAVAPFVILEIVGDKSDATIGYLIGGEEPISEGKSIKDMPSMEERTQKMSSFAASTPSETLTRLVGAGALTNDAAGYKEVTNGSKTMDIRGSFVADSNGNYYPKNPALTYVALQDSTDEYNRSLYGNIHKIYDDQNSRGIVLYNKIIEFSPSYQGQRYSITLKQHQDEVMPTYIEGAVASKADTYNGQYFEVVPIDGSTNLYEDALIFTGDSDALIYYGKVAEVAEGDNIEENTPDNADDAEDTENPDEEETPDNEEDGDEAVLYTVTFHPSNNSDPWSESIYNEGESIPDEWHAADPVKEGHKFLGWFYVINEDGDTEKFDFTTTITQDLDLYALYEAIPVTTCIQKADGTKVSLNSVRNGGYYRVVETNNVDYYETYYIISGYTHDANGIFGRNYGYKAVSGSLYGDYNAPEGRTYFLNEMGTDSYAYDPTNSSTHRFVADYAQGIYHTFLYEGGFTNNEWFKSYVLDRSEQNEYDDTSVDVITVTPDEVTEELAARAGLIYINVDNEKGNGDISVEAATAILSRVSSDDVAVMVEYSSLPSSAVADISSNSRTMLKKLLIMLMQNDEVPSAPTDWNAADLNWTTLYSGIYAGIDVNGTKDHSRVYRRIFINDDSGDRTAIVSDDFNTPYDPDKVRGGFGIIQEFNSKEEAKIRYLFEDSGWDGFNKEVTKATSVRYILNASKSYNESKGKLNILDLEPYQSDHFSDNDMRTVNNGGGNVTVSRIVQDKLTKQWFINNLGLEYASRQDDITITQMGTHEFIGRNENINETYDMIYIGTDTTIMNTEFTREEKSENTVYMDSSMNGLVYTHVGDVVDFDSSRAGSDGPIGNMRMAGNDITLDKYNALKKYIETGYAILLSDRLLLQGDEGNYSVNSMIVDTSSYMYKLLNEVVLQKLDDGTYKYLGRNIATKRTLETSDDKYMVNRESFNNYLSISKLELEVVSQPTSWAPSNTYLTKNTSDESYHLDFDIKLKSGTSAVNSSETYTCILYIDVDGDGKFEDGTSSSDAGETIGVYITNESGIYVDVDKLTVGHQYHIQAAMDSEYVGFIPWKLVFLQNETPDVESYFTKDIRVSISGFSAIPAEVGNKPTVRVLQVYDASSPGNTFVLNSDDMKNNYFSRIDDFDLNVDLMNMKDLVEKNTNPTNAGNVTNGIGFDAEKGPTIDFLNKYDMLVLGFTDFYKVSGGNHNQKMEMVRAIREYTLSGKSVLFTHDITNVSISSRNRDNSYFNEYIRDILGQDRYGITQSYLTDGGMSDSKYRYSSLYDYAAHRGTDTGETRGISDSTLLRYIQSKANIGFLARPDLKRWNESWNDNNKDLVTMINEGQITQYPFIITTQNSPTFEVSPTHPQVYQLNLDTDSSDANTNDDVVVWYTLGEKSIYRPGGAGVGNLLRGIPNDARNSYYIYSRGNIFYTGAGHRNVTQELEKKLFVNTLVAAYKSGSQSAKVIFKDLPVDGAADIDHLYVPYDPNMQVAGSDTTGGFLQDNVTVFFQAMNNSLEDSSLPINIKYYVKGDITGYSIKVGDGLDAVYYKEITPESIVLSSNGVDMAWGDKFKVQNYGMYTVKFRNSDFKLEATGDKAGDNDTLYIRVSTKELKDGDIDSLSAEESINALKLYSTKLFELE